MNIHSYTPAPLRDSDDPTVVWLGPTDYAFEGVGGSPAPRPRGKVLTPYFRGHLIGGTPVLRTPDSTGQNRTCKVPDRDRGEPDKSRQRRCESAMTMQ